MSISTLKSYKDRKKDTIGFRIQFIKDLLEGKMKTLIEFDQCETEYFKYGKPSKLYS